MILVGEILLLVLQAFQAVLFVRLIVDLIQMFAQSWVPRGPVLVILEAVYTVTDPPLRAIRRVIPPLRIGGAMLDLGYLVLFVVIFILIRVVAAVFFG